MTGFPTVLYSGSLRTTSVNIIKVNSLSWNKTLTFSEEEHSKHHKQVFHECGDCLGCKSYCTSTVHRTKDEMGQEVCGLPPQLNRKPFIFMSVIVFHLTTAAPLMLMIRIIIREDPKSKSHFVRWFTTFFLSYVNVDRATQDTSNFYKPGLVLKSAKLFQNQTKSKYYLQGQEWTSIEFVSKLLTLYCRIYISKFEGSLSKVHVSI